MNFHTKPKKAVFWPYFIEINKANKEFSNSIQIHVFNALITLFSYKIVVST